MSQPESSSTLFSPSKEAYGSLDKKRQKTDYAQLLGPSYVRLQALGFTGVTKSKIDLRIIDSTDGTSISDCVRALLTKKKIGSKLKFTSREIQKGNAPKTSYGYMSGTNGHFCHCRNST
jgi:hypothetical protein